MVDTSMKNRISQCVGCGYCCMKTPCDVSRRMYGNGIELCPQLLWNEERGRYLCGLMIIDGPLGAAYRKELYAGAGCCSSLNSWRQDVKKRSRGATQYSHISIPAMFQAFLKAYGSEPLRSGDATSLLLSSYKVELERLEYSKEEIASIMRSVIHYITSNKSSMFKDFMP